MTAPDLPLPTTPTDERALIAKAWADYCAQHGILGQRATSAELQRLGFVGGFLAGRASVTPNREAIAETLIAAEVAKPLRGLVDTGEPRPTHYAQADAILALLGVVPSTGNKETPDSDICPECGHHRLTEIFRGDGAMSHADWLAFNEWLANDKRKEATP